HRDVAVHQPTRSVPLRVYHLRHRVQDEYAWQRAPVSAADTRPCISCAVAALARRANRRCCSHEDESGQTVRVSTALGRNSQKNHGRSGSTRRPSTRRSTETPVLGAYRRSPTEWKMLFADRDGQPPTGSHSHAVGSIRTSLIQVSRCSPTRRRSSWKSVSPRNVSMERASCDTGSSVSTQAR